MHATIDSRTLSGPPESFSNGLWSQNAELNDVEACKDTLRGYIRPYLFDYSVNQLDKALKKVRQQLIEQQNNQPNMSSAFWNEMIEN